MRLTVNGTEHDVASPPLATLLHVLREELFVTSPKAGCQQGGCGACTVLVDGEPRRACLLPVAAVEGAQIATVEGLGEADELSAVQAAFHEHYAAQCGFCTVGLHDGRAGARRARRRRDRARGGDRGPQRPRVPLHRLREDRRRGHGRRPRRHVARRTPRPTPSRRATTPSPSSRGARHEGRRRPPAPLRRHRPRHGPHAVRRRRPRPRHAVVQGAALAAPQRAHPLDRHEQGRGAMPGVHAIVTHEDVPHNVYGHLEGLGVPADEPLLAERRRALEGPADRRRRRRVRGGRPGRGRRDRGRRSRSASRSSTSAPPPTPAPASTSTSGARSIRTSGRTTTAACARATSRRAFDAADLIVEGVYRPQAIEHCPMETQVSLVVPEPSGRADHLLLHAGDVLLDGRRRRAPAVAAEQAQVRRRHGRRRLRRQGRHGHRDDLRAAGDQGAAAGQVALHPRGGVPDLLDARAVAHRDPRRGDQRRLDPRPAHADPARRRAPTRASRPTG